ncbi:integral membrane protein, partial [Fusarium mundagurra]
MDLNEAMSIDWLDSDEDIDLLLEFSTRDQGETRCMICDVSFHINRHRTNGEHPAAAWNSHAGDDIGAYPGSQNCVQPDCTSIPRNGPGPGTSFLSPRNLDSSRFEHISGPHCRSTSAYHGSRISAEAMRECNTYQCLLRRDKSWEPQESELEDCEKQGRYVLSGLGDAKELNREGYYVQQVFPGRNNVDFPHIAYYTTKHAAVKRARQMYWMHHAGDEFLAANPCFIPALQDILDSVQSACSSDDICSDAAAVLSSTDLFSKLPQEIKLEILLQLDSWDIANLRLSSRTFRHLPQSLFYHLTLRELPWLYEAWSSDPLSFFVTTTAAEQRRLGKPLYDIQWKLWRRRNDNDGSEEDAAEIERLAILEAKLKEKQRQSYRTTPRFVAASIMTGRVPNVWAAIIIPVPASALALVLRIKARRMTKMGFGYDDALSIAAWFVALGYAILLIVWTTCYYMGRKIGHFPEDKIDHIIEKSHEILFVSEILYSWSIFLSKMSVLTFYRRIFQFSSIRVPIIILMKIAVIGIFSLGSLVGIASIFQIVEAQKYTSTSREFPYNFSLAMVWANVEVHLAVFT